MGPRLCRKHAFYTLDFNQALYCVRLILRYKIRRKNQRTFSRRIDQVYAPSAQRFINKVIGYNVPLVPTFPLGLNRYYTTWQLCWSIN
jgi:hypothetical protein